MNENEMLEIADWYANGGFPPGTFSQPQENLGTEET